MSKRTAMDDARDFYKGEGLYDEDLHALATKLQAIPSDACEQLKAKDHKLAELTVTLLGVDTVLQESIAMLRMAEPHRGESEAEILHMLRDRVKARGKR